MTNACKLFCGCAVIFSLVVHGSAQISASYLSDLGVRGKVRAITITASSAGERSPRTWTVYGNEDGDAVIRKFYSNTVPKTIAFEQSDAAGTLIRREHASLDKRGNVKTQTTVWFIRGVASAPLVSRCHYLSFDRSGNWTKRTVKELGKIFTEYRTIIYY
jgi:hypothetical protein